MHIHLYNGYLNDIANKMMEVRFATGAYKTKFANAVIDNINELALASGKDFATVNADAIKVYSIKMSPKVSA